MDACTFLRLLVEEAPAGRFEEEVQRAREQGVPEAELARVQEASYLALQLRLVLRERRRREVELAALYATAGDLISIRDPQRVLRAIARRARQLLDADTAYLTLIDEERGDTYMRVTEGMVTPEFGKVRLPLGVGLGGLVAETGMPYYTADYLKDDRFRHTGTIDTVVEAERLRAILGVPLKLSDRVIGVLFAADRHNRPFSPEEVNLLASLGAHAAIAIENARLFDRAHRALEELNATNAVVRAHSQAVERAAAAHEQLTSVVLQGGSLRDVADTVATVLGGTVLVVDPDGRPLPGAGEEPLDETLGAVLAEAMEAGRIASGGDAWVAPVAAGPDRLGGLVLLGCPDLDGADLRTFERAAQVTALLLLNQRSVAEAELRLRGDLLDDLLAGPHRDHEATHRRAHLLGIDLEQPQILLVASASGAERRALLAAAARLAEDHDGLAGEQQGAVVLLLPAGVADPGALVRQGLVAPLGVEVTCGVAEVHGPADLRDAYEEADRCRRTLLALGRTGQVARAADLGAFSLLLNQAGREDLERFVEATVGPVLAYDAERGTDLAGTLEAYFEAGGNVTEAARRLHVHVNTLYQRCERISSLLSPRWTRPDEALSIHLALQVRRIGALV